MPTLIMRFTGDGITPSQDLERVRSLPGCQVLDESGRMVLLEAEQLGAGELATLFPGWTAAPLKSEIGIPDTRKKPKRPTTQRH